MSDDAIADISTTVAPLDDPEDSTSTTMGDATRVILPIAEIDIGERLLPVDEGRVAEFMESIKTNGLLAPIIVSLRDHRLVVGRHRLEAAIRLGWTEIDCTCVDVGEDERLTLEIVENLHRQVLTPEQRDLHVRRYAELLAKKMGGQSAQPSPTDSLGRTKSPQQTPGIAAKVAEDTGLSRRTVSRVSKRPNQGGSAAGRQVRSAAPVSRRWRCPPRRPLEPTPPPLQAKVIPRK
jgi:hypothetical protein